MLHTLKRLLIELLFSLLLGLGTLFLLAPAGIFWWVYAEHARYVWIVTGPWPYNQLGNPSFQMGVFVAFVVMGLALVSLSIFLRALRLRALPPTR